MKYWGYVENGFYLVSCLSFFFCKGLLRGTTSDYEDEEIHLLYSVCSFRSHCDYAHRLSLVHFYPLFSSVTEHELYAMERCMLYRYLGGFSKLITGVFLFHQMQHWQCPVQQQAFVILALSISTTNIWYEFV